MVRGRDRRRALIGCEHLLSTGPRGSRPLSAGKREFCSRFRSAAVPCRFPCRAALVASHMCLPPPDLDRSFPGLVRTKHCKLQIINWQLQIAPPRAHAETASMRQPWWWQFATVNLQLASAAVSVPRLRRSACRLRSKAVQEHHTRQSRHTKGGALD